MKYIKMVCVACNGMGWNWGTTDEHARMKNYAQGVDRITCIHCQGTGIHKAEIVEEEEDEEEGQM